MSYHLGVDLGTTYTAAAVVRDDRAAVIDLGTRASVIPSVVFLREDEAVLTGEAADRRATTEPGRVAREFKRRIGDPTPIIVGGTPYSAASLMGKLLRWVVDKVSELEGGPPAGIAVSHPANWGDYKKDLLRQAIAIADLDDVATLTEPEAAAIHYASQSRIEVGTLVAVYDLGGGTFDAAVLRKTATGFEILGEPQGIERLGGVDFDEAVFQHVAQAIDGALDQLDPSDMTNLAAVTRLRAECVAAKEALSADTDVSIPVLLPNLQTEVRLTRAEFEGMIRPALADTITALNRALRSAGVETPGVSAVLLVGGSSRIPLVAQLVGAGLGRPVAVDAHPKHGIALGTAIVAAGASGPGAVVADAPVVDDSATVLGGAAPGAAAAAAAAPDLGTGGADGTIAGSPAPPAPAPPPAPAADDDTVVGHAPAAAAAGDQTVPGSSATSTPPAADPRQTVPPTAAGGPGAAGVPSTAADPDQTLAPQARPAPTPGAADATVPPGGVPPAAAPGAGAGGGRSRTGLYAAVAAVVVVVLIGAGIALSGGGDGDGVSAEGTTSTSADADADDDGAADTSRTSEQTTTSTTTTTAPTTSTTEFAPEGPFVRLDEVTLDGGRYRADWTVFNFTPVVGTGDDLHIHVFLDTTEPANAGTNGNPPGEWQLTDEADALVTDFGPGSRGAATQLCTVVATAEHGVFDPESGNCVDLPDA